MNMGDKELMELAALATATQQIEHDTHLRHTLVRAMRQRLKTVFGCTGTEWNQDEDRRVRVAHRDCQGVKLTMTVKAVYTPAEAREVAAALLQAADAAEGGDGTHKDG